MRSVKKGCRSFRLRHILSIKKVSASADSILTTAVAVASIRLGSAESFHTTALAVGYICLGCAESLSRPACRSIKERSRLALGSPRFNRSKRSSSVELSTGHFQEEPIYSTVLIRVLMRVLMRVLLRVLMRVTSFCCEWSTF